MTRNPKPRSGRVRKPRDFNGSDFRFEWNNFGVGDFIEVVSHEGILLAKDCRRLAQWLLAAAAYLEAREGK